MASRPHEKICIKMALSSIHIKRPPGNIRVKDSSAVYVEQKSYGSGDSFDQKSGCGNAESLL
jgi:hypothetical protein